MTFDDILEHAIEMLQRRGRVTYRTLKRQFHLDDEALEDLKFELIEGQRLATDEHGTVLVWTGDTESALAAVSQPVQPTLQPVAQEEPPIQAVSPQEPRVLDAERRQLTVMFCDLVGSTQLSSRLDPEDYREVVRAYQATCTKVIQRYEGHVAQLLGDGLLVYFGYPQAHEDDAHRAVHTALESIEAMGSLNMHLEQDHGITLAVRLGIHTGLVVVGAMGSEGRKEALALGEVPNVCARLQGLAEPNTVLISADTYRLIQGYFACQELGEQPLRGVPEPVAVYRVVRNNDAQSRLDVARTRGLTPLIGREQEVGLLVERWEHVKAGQGQVVLLTGDAGIGKSRLVQMLKEHVASEAHTRWECRSVPYYQNTALYPLTDLLQRTLQWQQDTTPDEKYGKLEQTLSQYSLPLEETVPLFAPLLSLPLSEHRYPLLNLSPQRQRQKLFEAIVAILLELAARHPVLFILEDLHWTDPTTLEVLHLLIDQIPTASLFVLLTCRSHFQPAWHHRSYMTEMALNHLSHTQVEKMVAGITDGKTFPNEVLAQVLEKTDGVPLFVEEMVKAVLESGHLHEVNGRYELRGSLTLFAIPATLQDSLMARLDRLVTGKAVAQWAAVIGRQFSYALLHAASRVDEGRLQHELSRLVAAEIVYQRGVPPQATYVFKHALIQDAAYASLLKSTRQQYHQRIAQVLEAQFPATAATQPELLAHHFTEAGRTEMAAHYWHDAGRHAIQRSAHMEAVAHLTTGLALLQTLPATRERTQDEVDVHLALGASLIATKGYAAPEVAQTYTQARHLCAHLDNPHQQFPVLLGLWGYYLGRVEMQTAHTLGEQLLDLARHTQDPAMLVSAYRALGSIAFYLGAFASAHTYCVQGIALCNHQQDHATVFHYGEDAGLPCRTFGAWTLWQLGYPAQGSKQIDDALTVAHHVAHPLSLGYAFSLAATLHQFRREARMAKTSAEAAIRLAQEQGFPYWMAHSAVLCGWARAQQGHAQEGIAQITQGLEAYRATGAEIRRPYFLALLAEAYGLRRQPEAGLTALAEALPLADKTGERWYEPELYRLKGALLLHQSSDHQAEAEHCFQKSLDIARQQQAKSWELRAATSLARLWQQQGKRQDAYELLAPIYTWFTEGFDTADLQDAKALLDAL